MDDLQYLDAYLSRVLDAVKSIEVAQLEQLANVIDRTISTQGHVFFVGNGGSAATATHYVNDLVMAYARTNRVLRTSSLTDNPALVSGIANDYSFEEIFEYQLRVLDSPATSSLLSPLLAIHRISCARLSTRIRQALARRQSLVSMVGDSNKW